MLARFRRKTSTQSIAVVLMLFALLAGQGVRLCLHTIDATPKHTATVHFENNLLTPDQPDDGGDHHVSLGLALVKQVSDGLLAIVVTVALVWLLPPLRNSFADSRSTPQRPSAGFRLRPPPRAPPL